MSGLDTSLSVATVRTALLSHRHGPGEGRTWVGGTGGGHVLR